MAWNISEIMEDENVPGCNLNIEQLERRLFLVKKKHYMQTNIQIYKCTQIFKFIYAHKYIQIY